MHRTRWYRRGCIAASGRGIYHRIAVSSQRRRGWKSAASSGQMPDNERQKVGQGRRRVCRRGAGGEYAVLYTSHLISVCGCGSSLGNCKLEGCESYLLPRPDPDSAASRTRTPQGIACGAPALPILSWHSTHCVDCCCGCCWHAFRTARWTIRHGEVEQQHGSNIQRRWKRTSTLQKCPSWTWAQAVVEAITVRMMQVERPSGQGPPCQPHADRYQAQDVTPIIAEQSNAIQFS